MIWETNPKGLHIAADFCRVKPLRILTLPYQKTNPKGLFLWVWALAVGVIITLHSLFNIRVIASAYHHSILAHCRPQITPSPPKSHVKNHRFHRINPQNNIQSRPPITPSQPTVPMNGPTSRLKSHNLRTLSPTNNPHSTLSTIKMSIARPILRNFYPIYSANNPIGVSLLAGQGWRIASTLHQQVIKMTTP